MKLFLYVACICATAVFGVEQSRFNTLLTTATTNQGVGYTDNRNEIVALGTNALPLLTQALTDTNRLWQEHLTARICYERIARGKDVDALRNHDWRLHPGFDPGWEKSMVGPKLKMWRITIPYLIDQGLWYYYIELTWKHTGELAVSPLWRINDSWLRWCQTAVAGQPEGLYNDSPRIAESLGYDSKIAPTSQPEVVYLRLVMEGRAERGASLTHFPEPPFRLGTNLVHVAP